MPPADATSTTAPSSDSMVLFSNVTCICSFDPFMATNGILGGLVAITASSPMVETEGAFVIGFASGALVFFGSNLLLKLKAREASCGEF